ncbi:MAG: ATP-binding protein [Erysipelotrichaceae bacterium]
MLINISIDNFLSYNDKQELNMITSSKIQKMKEHKVVIKGTPILKHCAIYGANAAGKSSLVKAFNFINEFVSKGFPSYGKEMYCRTNKDNATRVSTFEITFVIDDIFYAYGFEAILKEGKIRREWLYKLKSDCTYKVLFERNNKQVQKGDGLNLPFSELTIMNNWISDYNLDSHKLFLTFINEQAYGIENTKLRCLYDVFTWLTYGIDIYTPHMSKINLNHYSKPELLNKIKKIIKCFDVSISDVFLKEVEISEIEKEIEPEFYRNTINKLLSEKEDKPHVSMFNGKNYIKIECMPTGELKALVLNFKHDKSDFDFTLAEESDGTRRIFDFMHILLCDVPYKVFVVDELERSLHPKMTEAFIDLFDELHQDDKIQLIFTTHESTIMSQEFFRRDEIWFVKKDEDNHSVIYPLDSYEDRYDKVLNRTYLCGGYGAVPNIRKYEEEDSE